MLRYSFKWLGDVLRALYSRAMAHNPEKLLVLSKAKRLAIDVHVACDRHRRAMTDRAPTMRAQLLRAVDSIPLNIAEGAGKETVAAFIASLDIAIGSCNEVDTQLELSIEVFALPSTCKALRAQTEEVRRMSYGLRSYLVQNGDKPTPRKRQRASE